MHKSSLGVMLAACKGFVLLMLSAAYAQEGATHEPGGSATLTAPPPLVITETKSVGSDDGKLAQLMLLINESNAKGSLFAPLQVTGDALFDRYALEVDRLILAKVTLPDIWTNVASVPDATLAAWESEFGLDPRYWELRYFCAKVGRSSGQVSAGGVEPVIFLREAQQRGAATANTLLLLYGEERLVNQTALEAIGDGPGGGAELMRQQEQAELALLDAIVAAGSDEAWTYYTRAMYWFELGQPEMALRDLTTGNIAPKNAYPLPWPMNYVCSAPSLAAPPGSASVCGAIYSASFSYPLYSASFSNPLLNATEIKDHLLEMEVSLNLGACGNYLEPWHQFACRLGQSTRSAILSILVSAALDGRIRSYAEENSVGGAGDNTLLRCRGATFTLLAIAKDYNKQAGHEIQSSLLFTALDEKRGHYVARYLSLCVESSYVIAAQGVLADLSQVHYPELNLPPCMLKYEPLTKEDASRRNEERRQAKATVEP